MSKLYSSDHIIKVLLQQGFIFISQKGSHKKYRKTATHTLTVIVPANRKEIPFGTFKSILKHPDCLLKRLINNPMSSLTITLIQTNLHWEDKKANLEMFSKKIESIKEKTEIIILPEMFSTGFSMNAEILAEDMNGETVQRMKKIASEKKVILTGSIIIKEDNKYFNRLIWMLPNGEYGIYDKRHLFAYGDEHTQFTAGNKRLIASVKGWKINLLVCYDLRFPVWARQSHSISVPEYDLLIFVANWPEQRIHAWKTLLTARAIENQCYVVGVNCIGDDGNGIHYNGESMIIDPLGEILYNKKDAEAIFTYTLQKEKLNEAREKFPFWKDADSFNINM